MKKILAIIQLDIGDTTQKIIVNEGESIKQIAINFCKKFELNDECVEYLCETINKQIKSHKNIQKQNTSQSSSKQMINYMNEQEQIQEVSEENDTTFHDHSAKSSLHQQDAIFQKYQNDVEVKQSAQKQSQSEVNIQDNSKNKSLKDQFNDFKQQSNKIPKWQKAIEDNQILDNSYISESDHQQKIKNKFQSQKDSDNKEHQQKNHQFINFQRVLEIKSKRNSKSKEKHENQINSKQESKTQFKEDVIQSPIKQNIDNQHQKKQFLENLIQNYNYENNFKSYQNSSKDSSDFSSHQINNLNYDQNFQKSKINNDEAMAKYEFWQNAINQKVYYDMLQRNNQNPVPFLDKQQYFKQISQQNSPNHSIIKANKNVSKSPQNYQSKSPQNNKKIINQSKQIVNRSKTPPQKNILQAIQATDRLYQDGKKKLINKKKSDEAFREYHKKEYSFKPQINAQSQQIVQQLNSQKNLFSNYQIHDKLYFSNQLKEIETEIWRTEQFQKQYPFRPESNSPYRESLSQEEQQAQVKRMLEEKKKQEQKIEQKRMAMQQPIDKNTGQAYFHPKINKDRYYYQVKQRDDQEDQFYKEISISPQRSTNNSFRNQSPQNSSYSSLNMRKTPKDSKKNSSSFNQINNSLKSKSPFKKQQSPQKDETLLRQIFDDLDHDKDGLISEDQIDLGTIDINILSIIQDILFEIDESGKVFDYQMFNQLFKKEKFKGAYKLLNKLQCNQINNNGSFQKQSHKKNQFSFGESGDFQSNKHKLLNCKNPPEILYYNESNQKQLNNTPNKNIQMQIDKNFTPHYFQRLQQKQ